MALGDGIFRSRAASLLRASTPLASHLYAPDAIKEKGSKTSVEPPLTAEEKQDTRHGEPESAQSTLSTGRPYQSSGQDAVAHDREAQRVVRTIPAWVHPVDEDEDMLFTGAQSLPLIPPEIQVAHHNNAPSAKFLFRINRPEGRRFDCQREWMPPLPGGQVPDTGSQWKAFADASAYPALSPEGGEVVTEDWLAQNGADYSRPWLAGADSNGDPEKGAAATHMFKAKRRVWYVRAQRTILRSPIVPMVLRMIVWVFSAVALGLAGRIHHLTDNPDNSAKQTSSTDMAIVVDAVAMVYLLYITYDEYSGKPLGLRSARAKMRLIFLDLFFIVFDSANLSLAFETIRSPICSQDEDGICARQKGLASVLLIALIAWLLTFSISITRLVERVTGR